MNNFGFDILNTPDLTMQSLPDGSYPMIISDIRKVSFANGTKEILSDDAENTSDISIEIVFEVAEGVGQGFKYSPILSINKEGLAGQIARSTIKKILQVLEVDLTNASFDSIKNKPILIDIKTTTSKTDSTKTYQNIKNIRSIKEYSLDNKKVEQNTAPKKPNWGL